MRSETYEITFTGEAEGALRAEFDDCPAFSREVFQLIDDADVDLICLAGWLCLLVWCFVTGKFKNVEEPKLEMLRMEEEYERRGE